MSAHALQSVIFYQLWLSLIPMFITSWCAWTNHHHHPRGNFVAATPETSDQSNCDNEIHLKFQVLLQQICLVDGGLYPARFSSQDIQMWPSFLGPYLFHSERNHVQSII